MSMIKMKIYFEITKYPQINYSIEEFEQLLRVKEHIEKIKTQIAKKRKDKVTIYCGIAIVLIMITQTLLDLWGFLIDSFQRHFYCTFFHSKYPS